MRELIIAGQGGDGILFLGRTIAYSAFKENNSSRALPSYGPETRGGICNCQVKYSSEEIYSPEVEKPDTMIITTQASINKFLPSLDKNGILIYVPSRIKEKPTTKDIELIEVPAIINNSRDISNMFLLGAYIQIRKDINLETVIEKTFPEKMLKGKGIEILNKNVDEIRKGVDYIIENYPQHS